MVMRVCPSCYDFFVDYKPIPWLGMINEMYDDLVYTMCPHCECNLYYEGVFGYWNSSAVTGYDLRRNRKAMLTVSEAIRHEAI